MGAGNGVHTVEYNVNRKVVFRVSNINHDIYQLLDYLNH